MGRFFLCRRCGHHSVRYPYPEASGLSSAVVSRSNRCESPDDLFGLPLESGMIPAGIQWAVSDDSGIFTDMIGTDSRQVKLRVAAPEELKSGGALRIINAGFAQSSFGTVLIAEGAYGIYHISFLLEKKMQALNSLQAQWPYAELVRNDERAGEWCGKIFSTGCTEYVEQQNPPSLQLFVQGTDFQLRVWRALLGIPAGKTVSYGQLAALIGHPKAFRAVGAAVGSNPIAFLIPCHRVICSDGTIGGYRWGVQRKQALLEWEHRTCC